MGVGRGVGPSVGSGAHDGRVHPLDHRDGGLGVLGGAVGGGGDELGGAHEAPVGVAAVVGVLGHTGHGERVEHLQQQGPQAADEHGGVGVHPPGGAVGSEQPRIAVDRLTEVPNRLPIAGDHASDAAAESMADPGHGRVDRRTDGIADEGHRGGDRCGHPVERQIDHSPRGYGCTGRACGVGRHMGGGGPGVVDGAGRGVVR